ncbi:hypothetical protein A0H81_07615 [Grifola frondosa]|uniref:Uncharacterized protein n=1 Tax=Grifola frondosa TaxID=5627 RepID=A0A1C7M734_GRIFR|nr:hypothetical protein A0H81_07615 [Grifola frondosa]
MEAPASIFEHRPLGLNVSAIMHMSTGVDDVLDALLVMYGSSRNVSPIPLPPATHAQARESRPVAPEHADDSRLRPVD